MIDRLLREQRRERELLFLRDREGPLPLPEAAGRCRPLLPPGVPVPPVAAARFLDAMVRMTVPTEQLKVPNQTKSNDQIDADRKTGDW